MTKVVRIGQKPRVRLKRVFALLLLAACPSGPPTLSLTARPLRIDGLGQTSTLQVDALDGKMLPGKGSVKLTAAAGALMPETVQLANGTGTAEFSCVTASEPACSGRVSIVAEWKSAEGTAGAEVRVLVGLDGGLGPPDGGWCSAPGARLHDSSGYRTNPGGPATPNLSFLQFPEGFCVHAFGKVGNPRQLRFAPGGDLFVASPTTGTTSGGPQGLMQIVVLPDDDGDGLADTNLTWRAGKASTQGLLFHDGSLYYQDGTQIMREPYQAGDRAPTGTPVEVANITFYRSALHWPKTLDVSDDGTIYVSNGGDEGEVCDVSRPFHGGILALDSTADGGARQIAKGLRNAIYVRCHRDGHNQCFANELARDYSSAIGGREKLIPIRDGDDWGFPCCATKDLPYDDICLTCSAQTQTPGASTPMCMSTSRCSPRCDTTVAENASFIIGDTPFGLDFIDGQFPAPWDHRVYTAPHGAFGTWVGARVVAIAFDPATGNLFPGTNLPGQDAGTMVDFLTGYDDGTKSHGRPTDVTVSPDGRLFVSNDQTGDIIWVAPIAP